MLMPWMRRIGAAVFTIGFLPCASFAQESSPWDTRIVGDAFLSWRSNITVWYENYDRRRETTGDQYFTFDRLRLGAESLNDDGLSVRLSMEVTQPDASQQGRKGAYISPRDMEEPPAWQLAPQAAWARYQAGRGFAISGGLVPTSYIGFLNKAWRFRFLEKSPYELWLFRRAPLTDRFIVLEDAVSLRPVADPREPPTETDLGVTIDGRPLGPFVEYQIGYYAGEGNAIAETSPGKAGEARLTLYPLANVDLLEGLSLTGFVHAEKVEPDEEETLFRYCGLFHYSVLTRHGRSLGLGAELDNQIYRPRRDATEHEIIHSILFSFFFYTETAPDLFLVFRHDHLDPNNRNGTQSNGYKDEQSLFLLGLVYRFNAHVQVGGNLRLISKREEILNNAHKNRISDPEGFSFVQLGLEF
ncbi:MAG: hypothetical protein M5R36_03270 [Deltaproteobacteria bacterium]|nr:hypothetical protein [Deltaproteobacteria bacterium]